MGNKKSRVIAAGFVNDLTPQASAFSSANDSISHSEIKNQPLSENSFEKEQNSTTSPDSLLVSALENVTQNEDDEMFLNEFKNNRGELERARQTEAELKKQRDANKEADWEAKLGSKQNNLDKQIADIKEQRTEQTKRNEKAEPWRFSVRHSSAFIISRKTFTDSRQTSF